MLKNYCLTFLIKKNMCVIVRYHLRLGLKLKKIHRVLEFNQSQWSKPYIEFNRQKRIETENMERKIMQCLN